MPKRTLLRKLGRLALLCTGAFVLSRGTARLVGAGTGRRLGDITSPDRVVSFVNVSTLDVQLAPPNTYALIVPMHSTTQLEVMRVTWSLFPPCNETLRKSAEIDLIFLTDVQLSSMTVPGHGCFKTVFQLKPMVPSCYNSYSQFAPYSFFNMMLQQDLNQKYIALLQIEADSVPVTVNWLPISVSTVLEPASGHVWIHAATNLLHENNFNGNAAYNLQNYEFRLFLFKYREWFYSTVSGDTAFDTNMIKFARDTGQLVPFTQKHLHAASGLRNCDLMSLTNCRSSVDPATWGGAIPGTILVHSHYFKDPAMVKEQLLLELLGAENR